MGPRRSRTKILPADAEKDAIHDTDHYETYTQGLCHEIVRVLSTPNNRLEVVNYTCRSPLADQPMPREEKLDSSTTYSVFLPTTRILYIRDDPLAAINSRFSVLWPNPFPADVMMSR